MVASTSTFVAPSHSPAPNPFTASTRSGSPFINSATHRQVGTCPDTGKALVQMKSVKEIGRSSKAALEAESKGLYSILTTDCEIPLAYLLRDEPTSIRVGHFIGFQRTDQLTKQLVDEWPLVSRGVWEVSVIEKAAVVKMTRKD